MPVVVFKEHDDPRMPWIGRGDGRATGWPVFREGAVVPRLGDIKVEPRLPLSNLKQVKERVAHFRKRWGDGAPHPGPGGERVLSRTLLEHRERIDEAKAWWLGFFHGHDEEFQGTIVSGSCVNTAALVPRPVGDVGEASGSGASPQRSQPLIAR